MAVKGVMGATEGVMEGACIAQPTPKGTQNSM